MVRETQMQSCIDDCTRCHAICTETIQYCLEKGGKYAEANLVRLLQDCAQMCATSADFMLRGSEFHPSTCGVCAEVCDRCARACEQVGGADDAEMKQCAETCRRCAQCCHEMSKRRRAAA